MLSTHKKMDKKTDVGHSVHKIGGTSMSQVNAVMDNILVGDRSEDELYNRVFVVSAYGGFTDLLLENKKPVRLASISFMPDRKPTGHGGIP